MYTLLNDINSLGEKVRQAIRLDRAVRFVWRAGPGWTTTSLFLVVIQGVLPLLALYLLNLIVDAATFSLSAPDKATAFRYVALLIACAAGVALFNALIQLLSGLVKEAQSVTVTDHMYDVLHVKSVENDDSLFDG